MLKFGSLIFMLLFLMGCDYWEMDECLEKGGIWNPTEGVCEFENSNTLRDDGKLKPE